MFKKRLEYEILRYYSIIIFSFFLATPVFAQIENNQRNQSSPTITIENNPQNFQNPTPFPISSYIDEIDKKNQLLKKDLLLLRNQVNNLSKEIGTVKNSDNNGFI